MADEGKGDSFVCQVCNISVQGKNQMEQHLLSKNHIRRASNESQFDLQEKNLFVDVTTNAYKTLTESKAQLVGCEYVVYDRDSQETKCTCCRVLLKDDVSILTHVKSFKHVQVFFKHHYPNVFEQLQKRCKNRADLSGRIAEYSELLLKKYGGKKDPRVHQNHYYDSLSQERRKEVDLVMIKRQMEMAEQREFALKDKLDGGVDRSPPRRRHHSRSKSRERRSSRDSRRRSRSPRKSREKSYSRERFSSPKHGRDLRDDGRRERRHESPARVDPSTMESLPTDPDIFQRLIASRTAEFDRGERAYIQDLVDAIPGSVIGLEYVGEYSDPKGLYEPGYMCFLCKLRFNPAQAVQHCVSDSHSMEYLKKHHQKQHMALCIGTLGEEVRRQMKMRYLAEIEAGSVNRRNIVKKILLSPDNRQVFLHHKRVSGIVQDYGHHHGAGNQGHDFPPQQEDVYEKPVGKFASRAAELVELERSLPPYCQKDLAMGWYSVRSKSWDYFRQLALARNPEALYFSVRDPYGKTAFYGEWNPQLMRRLQDKFGFKLEHLSWLQKLLTDWRIPTYAPVQDADLAPLKQEVESAVLNELLGQVLKPVNALRGLKTVVYETYDEEDTTRVRAQSPPPIRLPAGMTKRRFEDGSQPRFAANEAREDAEMFREKKTPKLNPDPPPVLKIGLKAQQRQLLQPNAAVAAKLGGPADSDEEKEMMEEEKAAAEERRSRWAEEKPPDDPKETEVEKKLRSVIDSVLRIAQQASQTKNPIMQLLSEFDNARDILFRLATRQPAQLQQLVTVARNPGLTVPPEVLSQLRRRLKEVEEEVLAQRADEAARKRKEADEKALEEAAKVALMRKKLDEEAAKKAAGLQVLTPKIPGAYAGGSGQPFHDPPQQGMPQRSQPGSNLFSQDSFLSLVSSQSQTPFSQTAFPQTAFPPPQTSQVLAAVQRALAPPSVANTSILGSLTANTTNNPSSVVGSLEGPRPLMSGYFPPQQAPPPPMYGYGIPRPRFGMGGFNRPRF